MNALLVIDVQQAILNIPDKPRGVETAQALDAVVSRIATLIARCREQRIPVVYVQHDAPVGDRLQAGTEGWRIRKEIAPLSSDTVIHKTACDSFYNTALGEHLQGLGAKHLIVAGCMTQFCVDTTVRRAVTLGYDVTLAADAHMTEDSGALTFEQIIQHHNALLNGFDAGPNLVTVKPIDVLALH